MWVAVDLHVAVELAGEFASDAVEADAAVRAVGKVAARHASMDVGVRFTDHRVKACAGAMDSDAPVGPSLQN